MAQDRLRKACDDATAACIAQLTSDSVDMPMREAIIKDIDVVAKDVLLHDSLYVGPNSEVHL